MANVAIKISQLKSLTGSAITTDDFIPVVDSGSMRTYKITVGDVVNMAQGGVASLLGGTDKQVLYNQGGIINGDAGFQFNYVSKSLQNGSGSLAYGLYSHAEGFQTFTSAAFAHVEGYQTYAFGKASHAGGYQTYAYGDYQTVVGQFNVNNPQNTSSLFIVGGGIDDSNRADVLLVDRTGITINGDLNFNGSLLKNSQTYIPATASYALISETTLNGGSGVGYWLPSGSNGSIYYNNGYVGFGNGSPEYQIDISGSIGNSMGDFNIETIKDSNAYLKFYPTANGYEKDGLGLIFNDNLRFKVNVNTDSSGEHADMFFLSSASYSDNPGYMGNVFGMHVKNMNISEDDRMFVWRIKDPASAYSHTNGTDRGSYNLFENRLDPLSQERGYYGVYGNFLMCDQYGNVGLGNLTDMSDANGIWPQSKVSVYGSDSNSSYEIFSISDSVQNNIEIFKVYNDGKVYINSGLYVNSQAVFAEQTGSTKKSLVNQTNYWTLNSILSDETGGNSLIPSGSVTYVSGLVGNAYSASTSHSLTTTSPITVYDAQPRTLSAAFKLLAHNGVNSQGIVSYGSYDNNNNAFEILWHDASNQLWLHFLGEQVIYTPSSDLVDGKWHIVTAVWDGHYAFLYFDGIQVGNVQTSIDTTQSKLCIGSRLDYSEYFSGYIQDVMLLERPITPLEVKNLYENYYPSYIGSAFFSTTNNNSFVNSNGGNFGVGIRNPIHKLHVSGSISSSGLMSPISSSLIPKFTGSLFYSSSKLFIYTGIGNAGGMSGWQTASLGG
jgi:hypothetical protein